MIEPKDQIALVNLFRRIELDDEQIESLLFMITMWLADRVVENNPSFMDIEGNGGVEQGEIESKNFTDEELEKAFAYYNGEGGRSKEIDERYEGNDNTDTQYESIVNVENENKNIEVLVGEF